MRVWVRVLRGGWFTDPSGARVERCRHEVFFARADDAERWEREGRVEIRQPVQRVRVNVEARQ